MSVPDIDVYSEVFLKLHPNLPRLREPRIWKAPILKNAPVQPFRAHLCTLDRQCLHAMRFKVVPFILRFFGALAHSFPRRRNKWRRRIRLSSTTMPPLVTTTTKRDQVLWCVITKLTSRPQVMNVEVD